MLCRPMYVPFYFHQRRHQSSIINTVHTNTMNTTVHTGCRLCLMFVPRSFFHYIYLAHALNPLLFSFRMLFLSFQIENMQQRQHIHTRQWY